MVVSGSVNVVVVSGKVSVIVELLVSVVDVVGGSVGGSEVVVDEVVEVVGSSVVVVGDSVVVVGG